MNCLSTGDQLFLIEQDQLKLMNFIASKPLVQLLFTSQEQQYLLVGSADKQLRCWELNQMKLVYQVGLPKKIKKLVRVKEIIYVSDKHGDIFDIQISEICSPQLVQTNKKETEAIQTNLATPKCFAYVREVLLLGDSYSKIKLFNEKNTDQIIQIWVLLEGYLKQFIPLGEGFLLLFKRAGEDELKYYELYYMGGNNFPAENPSLTLLYPQNESQMEISKNSDSSKILVDEGRLYLLCQQEKDLRVFKLDVSNPKSVKQEELWRMENALMMDAVVHKGVVVSYQKAGGNNQSESMKLIVNESVRVGIDKYIHYVHQ